MRVIFLETTPESYGGLRITELARPVLRGEIPIHLRKRLPKSRLLDRGEPRRRTESSPQHAQLAESLRELRKRLAAAQGLPPFVIFHDATLIDLLQKRPKTNHDLLRVLGMGEIKVQRYGTAILECIAAHSLDPLLNNYFSDTVNLTLIQFAAGSNPKRIAEERNLTIGTIYSHLAEAIKVNKLRIDDVIQLETSEYNIIVRAIKEHNICTTAAFKLVYEALDKRYDYGILKCIAAAECK